MTASGAVVRGERPARPAPRSLRIPFVRRCFVRRGGEETPALLLDLSVNGVFVAASELPAEAERLVLRFRVPGNERWIETEGVVAWVHRKQTHPVHGIPPGFGLRFVGLDEADARRIAETIRAYCESNPIYRQYL